MYTNIIFVQDNETLDEVQEIFSDGGYVAAISYLAQWDYGYESEYDIVEEVPHNRYENRYEYNMNGDEYILIEHPLYMALYRKAYED